MRWDPTCRSAWSAAGPWSKATGEKVTPLDFEPRTFLLLVPPFGVNTAKVYAAWDALAGPHGATDEQANALTAAALAVEPRLARWRDALRDVTGRQPTLAGSGSTWFVEVGASTGPEEPLWLTQGDERARLIPARTVPAGWDGS